MHNKIENNKYLIKNDFVKFEEDYNLNKNLNYIVSGNSTVDWMDGIIKYDKKDKSFIVPFEDMSELDARKYMELEEKVLNEIKIRKKEMLEAEEERKRIRKIKIQLLL